LLEYLGSILINALFQVLLSLNFLRYWCWEASERVLTSFEILKFFFFFTLQSRGLGRGGGWREGGVTKSWRGVAVGRFWHLFIQSSFRFEASTPTGLPCRLLLPLSGCCAYQRRGRLFPHRKSQKGEKWF